MSKKDTNTLLIAGGIGILALVLIGSKGKEALQGLMPGGINFSAPINIPGLSDILPGFGTRPAEDETESGCRPTGLTQREAPDTIIVYPNVPDVIYDPQDITIGKQSYQVIPKIPNINVTGVDWFKEVVSSWYKLPFISGIEQISNIFRYGSPLVAVVPLEEAGQLDQPPVCEGGICPSGMGGFTPFWQSPEVGASEKESGITGGKSVTPSQPTTYAPAAPVVKTGGGEKKELYIV